MTGGSTTTRRAGRLVPPSSLCETAAATRVCPASGTEPDVEASEDRSPGSLTHHLPASPFPCISDMYREPHGGEDSSVALLSASSPTCYKVSSSRAAACDATDPNPEADVEGSAVRNTEMLHKISDTRGRQGRYRNLKPDASEVAVAIVSSSFAPSVSVGAQSESEIVRSNLLMQDKEQRRLPAKIDSAKSSAILENMRLQKTKQPSQLQKGGADSDCRDPQVSRKKNDVSDGRYWQTDNVSSHISSASGRKLEFVDAFEGGIRSTQFKKPLAMSPREPVRFRFRNLPRRPVLDRRGALDATSESTLLQTHNGCPRLGSTWEGQTYLTTQGPGGGYGYPHPPPFYRCEVCLEKTAFYRLKCCHTVICECCSCSCGSAEAEKGKRFQYQREKLPKVKLEGSDLFLWQPFSFPYGQMLWMARRTENHLQYYFAPIHQLMDPTADLVDVCVYDFCQQEQQVISLSKTEKRLTRNLLR